MTPRTRDPLLPVLFVAMLGGVLAGIVTAVLLQASLARLDVAGCIDLTQAAQLLGVQ